MGRTAVASGIGRDPEYCRAEGVSRLYHHQRHPAGAAQRCADSPRRSAAQAQRVSPRFGGQRRRAFHGCVSEIGSIRYAAFLRGQGVHRALRLWNEGGAAERNGRFCVFGVRKPVWILNAAAQRSRSRSWAGPVFEQEQVFAWPDKKAAETGGAVLFRAAGPAGRKLSDGTVVPCCLITRGDVPLGESL